jgi:hypothetical protein
MYIDCCDVYYSTCIFDLRCIFDIYIDFDIIFHVYYAFSYHVDVDVV